MNLLKTLVIVGGIAGLFVCFSSNRIWADSNTLDDHVSKSIEIVSLDDQIALQVRLLDALEISRGNLRIFQRFDIPQDAKRVDKEYAYLDKEVNKKSSEIADLKNKRKSLLKQNPELNVKLDGKRVYKYLADNALSKEEKDALFNLAIAEITRDHDSYSVVSPPQLTLGDILQQFQDIQR
jgi:hypothetical protein